uniref:Uncharacterized protein n=1 Tax=Arundo donax TaxID=35708 RepID=A0A0A9HJC8_ARUDO
MLSTPVNCFKCTPFASTDTLYQRRRLFKENGGNQPVMCTQFECLTMQ